MDYSAAAEQTPPPAFVQTLSADDTTTAPATTAAATSASASGASTPDYSNNLTGDWFGLRPQLQNAGITFGGFLDTDGSWCFSGGRSTSTSAYRTLLNLNVSFDLNQLFGLQGGTFYASYEGFFGQNGSVTQVGSLQPFDNNDAPRFSEVYELYYNQFLGNQQSPLLQLRVGRQDAIDFFSNPPDAGMFINSSPTAFPTIIGSSLYPNSAPGIVAVLFPTPPGGSPPPLTLKFGAYYFDRMYPSAFDAVWNTLEPANLPAGTFLIGEADYNWQINNSLPGVLAGGYSWRTGDLPTLNGSTQSGAGSGYIYIDQTLWNNAQNQSIAAFEVLSAGDRNVSAIDYSSLGGLLGTGLVPTRPNDQVGFGYDWAHVSSQADLPKPYELALEGFYALNLGHGITVQPDLQYFVNTGGGVYPDALVGLVRLSLNF
ncbi:MAG TPA: carbohydrate porin [Phycisphaerae bacterium]|nr:carbohydrate porin [Phycisphaerae bacterium]